MRRSEFGWEIKYIKSRDGWYIVRDDGDTAPATCADVMLWAMLGAVRAIGAPKPTTRRTPCPGRGRFTSR